MCLISNTNTPLIAKEDIVVYKIIMRKNNKDYAPVVSEDEELPHYIYKKGVNKARFKEDVSWAWNCYYRIGKGFLHAYTTKDIAEKNCDRWNAWVGRSNLCTGVKYHFVVRMIIPKGTEYFNSVEGDEICAKELIWE